MPADRSAIEQATNSLIAWLERHNFQGYDPHDALNSPVLGALGRRNRWLGVAFVQLLRRLPVNFRPWLRVQVGYNPKGMGLFLSSFLRRYAYSRNDADLKRALFFADWLRENISQGYSGACWGYNFDWPNRSFYAPAGTPTLVNTAFIANAFLDLAELTGNAYAFQVARSACDFILNDLNQHQDGSGLCFSYTPLDRRWVHNANLLGAALLARVGHISGEQVLRDAAIQSAAFSVSAQCHDGSWHYGVGSNDGWIDNFHTGFVLVALADVIEYTRQHDWNSVIERGYHYWKTNFFRSDSAPKYYPDHLYPIDIHCVAQAVLTFLRLRDSDPSAVALADCTLLWGIQNFQDPKGYFYYQIQSFYCNRIPYIRWSQAWMLRALTEWLWDDAIASIRFGSKSKEGS